VSAKKPIEKLRWRMAALLFCATVINYVDRQTLSVMASEITADLGLSNIDYSNVLQAFLVCYTGMYLLAGYLIDRWGTRMALAVSMVWWSLANTLHAASRGALAALRRPVAVARCPVASTGGSTFPKPNAGMFA